MTERLLTGPSPHLRGDWTTRKIMGWVVLALLPAILASGYFFGPRVWLLYLLATVTALVAESLWFKFTNKTATHDLSAVVTALLLTMNLPPSAPWYFPVIGTFFAIIVVKEFFGGLGYNFLNPALGGRALLVGLFFTEMFKISWSAPPFDRIPPEVVTQATPLELLRNGELLSGSFLWSSFIGDIGGRIGETSSLLLLLGGGLLLWQGIIHIRIPATIFVTVGLGVWLFSGEGLASWQTVLGHLTGGGLILGSIYMATDYASSPATVLGEYLYALGIGLIILLFRFWGATYEGVSYAILTMNCATPLIDRLIRRRVLGEPGSKTLGVKLDH